MKWATRKGRLNSEDLDQPNSGAQTLEIFQKTHRQGPGKWLRNAYWSDQGSVPALVETFAMASGTRTMQQRRRTVVLNALPLTECVTTVELQRHLGFHPIPPEAHCLNLS